MSTQREAGPTCGQAGTWCGCARVVVWPCRIKKSFSVVDFAVLHRGDLRTPSGGQCRYVYCERFGRVVH